MRNGRIGSRATRSVGLQGRRACGLHSGLPHGIVGTVQPVLGGVAGRGVGLHSPNNPSPGELGAASHSLGSQYLGTCGNPGCGWCMVAGYRQERHGTVLGHKMSIRVHVRGLSHSAQHTGPVRDHELVSRHARQLHDRGAQQVEKAKPPGTLGSQPQSASPSGTCWAHVRRPWPPATIGRTPEGTSCSAEPHRSRRHCSRSKCQGGDSCAGNAQLHCHPCTCQHAGEAMGACSRLPANTTSLDVTKSGPISASSSSRHALTFR